MSSKPDQNNFAQRFRAINKNKEIKSLKSFGDKVSDTITSIAGSVGFLLFNVVVFAGWLLVNTGQFGQRYVFDEYPFGLLTTAVSLEAIILAVFVLITQNRQSKHSEIRSELDYVTDLHTNVEINTIISMLQRLADKQNINITDLLTQLEADHRKVTKEHPTSTQSLDD